MVEIALRYFMMAVTLIVMAVPEGLPMAVTLALALNMRRMLKSNNLVRKLQASETMGAVTVICTDKTGTLTENRMEVNDIKTTSLDSQELNGATSLDSQELYKAIALNTTATHEVGNPTEQALLRWLMVQGVDYQKLREENPITAREPFSTERKYMTTTIGDTLYIKGAPEVVTDFLEKKGQKVEVKALQATLLEWQRHAMRTLAIAWVKLSPDTSSVNSPSVPGFAIVAISDPLRKEVPAAIRQCEKAGIDVKIVTGDTAETALEIGRQTGIIDPTAPMSPARSVAITGAAFAACALAC